MSAVWAIAARPVDGKISMKIGYLAALTLAFSVDAARAQGLDARVETVIKSPGYQNARWGLLVVDAKSGQVVYERNPDLMFCPASVAKLFSTAAALVDLGQDFRFQTPVARRGDVDVSGTLRGDLVLVAQGDLSLGGRTGKDGALLFENTDHTYAAGNNKATLVPSDPLSGLDSLAREVKAAGVTRVAGDVIVDDRLFETAPSSGSGPREVSPIVVNDNVVDILVSPAAKVGDPPEVKMLPRTAYVAMEQSVSTAAEGTRPSIDVRAEGPRRFSIRGRIPIGRQPIVKVYEIEDPASYARALFIERLRERGVDVAASPLASNNVSSLPPRDHVLKLPKVAEYTSPPFSDYLRVILKVSHNLHASTLPLLIAARHGERTLNDGLRREGEILKRLGVDVATISFGGGAGGSRADLVTPRATVALLRAMAGRSDYSTYEGALPILGRDGTLAESVSANSPVRGHARAKTGTFWVENGLNGSAVLTSKALAGTMETSSGRRLVFAFFVNDVPIDASSIDAITEATAGAGKLLGRLCEAFYADDKSEPSAAR
jgi:serine-type D-Ala-D-Ala carboxypeptidase/endopeptidase (penicillin-binding protein 4)